MAKIIIVDDDPAMVSVLSEVLREHHHEVIPASGPEKAFQLVKEQSPDLVLADIEMPEGKPLGLKLLQQVKDYNQSIPTIMITGQGTKERAVQALAPVRTISSKNHFRLTSWSSVSTTRCYSRRRCMLLRRTWNSAANSRINSASTP